MTNRTNERNALHLQPETPEAETSSASSTKPTRRRAGWLAAAAAASLLAITPVLAHGGTVGGAQTDGTASTPWNGAPQAGSYGHMHGGYGGYGPMHGGMGFGGMWGGATRGGSFGGYGPMHGGTAFGGMWGGAGPNQGDVAGPRGLPFGNRARPGTGTMMPGMLQGLPIGTTVDAHLYAADPSEGAEAVATLSAVVGETSEAAFAQELQAAASEAAFLTIDIGERTERIDLTDTTRPAPNGLLGRAGGPLELGQTISVAFFASADDAVPSATLSFTFGEDSMIGFHQAIADAAAESDAVEVTRPAQSRTLDLTAAPFGGAAAPGYGPGYGPGMRGRSGMGYGGMGYGAPGR